MIRSHASGLRALALPLVSALALAGCEQAGASAGWAGTVDTLANGAVLVSNPETGMWTPEEAWRLEADLRIGSADVEGPDLFGQIGAIAVDRLGRIWVAESQAQEIRVFDAEGRHVRTIGRKGGGPGEFGNISGMAWAADGNLWVMDPNNSRISVFDTTGAYVTSHRRQGGFVMFPWRGGVDREGRVYDVVGIPTDGRFDQVLLRYDASMEPQDTFRFPEFEQRTFDLTDDGGRRRMSMWIPFAASQTWRLDQDGHVWMGITDSYRIHRLGFDGDTLAVVERKFSPVPVGAEEKEEALKRLDSFVRQGGKIDPSKIPSTKPAFNSFFTDDQGYLWVSAAQAEGEPAGYDVFDPEGRFLGRTTGDVEFAGFNAPVIIGDTFYGVIQDDLEIPYVVRGRIVGRG